ncbi:MAG: hypothetical protein ACI9FJ_000222 [Alteromonadaceae bacterium]|jgi:hypothetical protein
MATILEYLNAVDADAKIKQAHGKDPTSTMKKFGLSDEEIDALMTRDGKKIATLTGMDIAAANGIQIVHTANK